MRLVLCVALLATCACDASDCNNYTSDVGDICLPDMLTADVVSNIEIRELCGPGCSHPPGCTAVFRNGVVELDVEQEICGEAQFGQCIALPCIQRITRCTLPALPAGSYTLKAPGSPPRLLHVAAQGTATCRFPVAADGGT